jgi:predicted transcriptional regulator
MLQLNLPEHIEAELESAADLAGRTKEELAAELLASHFEDQSLPLSALTEAQLTRFQESLGQIKRGEVVTEEQVNRKFEAWFAKLDSR